MDPTIIVSGFPRTGTSTMMRMIYFGGVEALTSQHTREANNEFDPYGSFELDNVGQDLNTNPPDWSAGKVVKLVAPYIPMLPMDREYRVVFMARDLTEIIASLMAMQIVWEHAPDDCVRYARLFLTENEIPTHYVDYHDMVKYPKSTAMGVADFLERDMSVDEMIKAVDPNARHKHKPFSKKHPDKDMKRPDIITFGRKISTVEGYDRTDLPLQEHLKLYKDGKLKQAIIS